MAYGGYGYGNIYDDYGARKERMAIVLDAEGRAMSVGAEGVQNDHSVLGHVAREVTSGDPLKDVADMVDVGAEEEASKKLSVRQRLKHHVPQFSQITYPTRKPSIFCLDPVIPHPFPSQQPFNNPS